MALIALEGRHIGILFTENVTVQEHLSRDEFRVDLSWLFEKNLFQWSRGLKRLF